MDRRRDRLSRRRFVLGAGSAGIVVGCGRLPWQGQAEQAAKVPRIGVLSLGSADPSDIDNAAFRQGLRDLGYSEGQNVTLERRSPADRIDEYPELAADLVRLPVDVIVTQGTPATLAAKQASGAIPIVFVSLNDPVGLGLVASVARPGGNVTGLSVFDTELSAKRLELLQVAVPGASRVAILSNTGQVGLERQFREMEEGAQTLGLQLQLLEVPGPADIPSKPRQRSLYTYVHWA